MKDNIFVFPKLYKITLILVYRCTVLYNNNMPTLYFLADAGIGISIFKF